MDIGLCIGYIIMDEETGKFERGNGCCDREFKEACLFFSVDDTKEWINEIMNDNRRYKIYEVEYSMKVIKTIDTVNKI